VAIANALQREAATSRKSGRATRAPSRFNCNAIPSLKSLQLIFIAVL